MVEGGGREAGWVVGGCVCVTGEREEGGGQKGEEVVVVVHTRYMTKMFIQTRQCMHRIKVADMSTAKIPSSDLEHPGEERI